MNDTQETLRSDDNVRKSHMLILTRSLFSSWPAQEGLNSCLQSPEVRRRGRLILRVCGQGFS